MSHFVLESSLIVNYSQVAQRVISQLLTLAAIDENEDIKV
jgi:hypothetical protein